uniref:Uncharacterized protein n=1 Tax=Oryza rufipogon TaxID=4529 RepID=A0A0E0QL55_ORYRU
MAGAARIASIAGCGDGGALRRPRCQIRRLFALYSGDLHLQIRVVYSPPCAKNGMEDWIEELLAIECS